MPVVHYRRQFGDPLTNLFGTGISTAATTPTPSVLPTTAVTTTAAVPSDPLGGLTSAVASILSPILSPILSATLPTTTSSAVTPTTPSTTSAIPTTTPPTSTPTVPLTSTVDVTSTTTPTPTQASAIAPPSSSPSATDTPTSNSTMATAIIGSLVGLFALVLIVSFFLRRCNRNRSRLKARESISFNPDEFRRSAAVLKDDYSARVTEQKGYPDSAYHAPSVAGPAAAAAYQPEARPFTPEHSYQQAAYVPALYTQSPTQQQSFSPHPYHAYPTAAQQVAFEYRGVPAPIAPNTMVESTMPNSHPVTRSEDEGAYGGI